MTHGDLLWLIVTGSDWQGLTVTDSDWEYITVIYCNWRWLSVTGSDWLWLIGTNSNLWWLKVIVGPKGYRPYSFFSPSSPPSPAIKSTINKTSVFWWFQHSNQHFIHRRKEDSTGVHREKTNTTTKTNTETNTTNTETNTKTKFRKYKTCAIFLKSRGFRDIKYDILSSVRLSFGAQLSSSVQ